MRNTLTLSRLLSSFAAVVVLAGCVSAQHSDLMNTQSEEDPQQYVHNLLLNPVTISMRISANVISDFG